MQQKLKQFACYVLISTPTIGCWWSQWVAMAACEDYGSGVCGMWVWVVLLCFVLLFQAKPIRVCNPFGKVPQCDCQLSSHCGDAFPHGFWNWGVHDPKVKMGENSVQIFAVTKTSRSLLLFTISLLQSWLWVHHIHALRKHSKKVLQDFFDEKKESVDVLLQTVSDTCCCNCRYMGTITGMGDIDPMRWPKSHWRSLKVHTLQCYICQL
jgi:hypothetical protein